MQSKVMLFLIRTLFYVVLFKFLEKKGFSVNIIGIIVGILLLIMIGRQIWMDYRKKPKE